MTLMQSTKLEGVRGGILGILLLFPWGAQEEGPPFFCRFCLDVKAGITTGLRREAALGNKGDGRGAEDQSPATLEPGFP